MNTTANYALKGDLQTAVWTNKPSKLLATYVDAENTYWYAVSQSDSGKNEIRKMSITRNAEYARTINKKAKTLLGEMVYFGCTAGWNPDVWFNNIATTQAD